MAQKKRAKPQDDTKRVRNSQVKIRLSEDEVGDLKAAATNAGMSMADFIMASVHDRQVILLPGAVGLRQEMIREGRNLNQAIHVAYLERKEGRPADVELLIAAAVKVEENLDRLADLILKWDIDLAESVRKENDNANNEVCSEQGHAG